MLPILPAAAIEPSTVRIATGAQMGPTVPGAVVVVTPSRAPSVEWTVAALSLWALGVSLSAVLGVRRWRTVRRTIRRSAPAHPGIAAMAVEITNLLSLRTTPPVQMSEEIESPLVTGLFRPVVLLPATRFPQMDADRQRMAICHELAHLKRGDVWLGCVPAAAERLFFFHPLVRLAAREYIFWREAACDAAVLRALGTAPQASGRLLLDLGITRPQPALAAAGAAWSFSNLKRRIVMLQQPPTSRPGTRLLAGGIIAIAALAVTPLRLGARDAVLPPVPPLSKWVTTRAMPMPAGAPDAAMPVAGKVAQETPRQSRQRDELRFVFMTDEITNMSGNRGDIERARSLRQRGETLLWFMQDGKEYVIRDPEVLKQIKEAWEPVSRVGAEQGAIGAKQGAVGARQAEIGARQGRIGAEQAEIGARQAEIGARQAALATREVRQASERDQAEVRAERRALEQKMQDLGRDMETLGEKMDAERQPMDKLGTEMEALGGQMSALGKQMEEASRQAEARMRALIERAVASGTAQLVK